MARPEPDQAIVVVADVIPPDPRSGGSLRRRRLAQALAARGAPLVLTTAPADVDTTWNDGEITVLSDWSGPPEVCWCVGPQCWRALPAEWRAAAVVDLIDRPSTNSAMLAMTCLSLAWRPLGMSRMTYVRRALAHAVGAARGRWNEQRMVRAGALLVVADRAEAERGRRVWVPNGYDTVEPVGRGPIDRFVLPASYRYEPNLHGLRWFVDEVVPRLCGVAASCPLCIAGSQARRVAALAGTIGAEVVSDPPQMSDAFTPGSAVLVPLRRGTGSRIKILEAWALGYPVVSTSAGASGLDAVDGRNALIADSADEFADACRRLITDSAMAERLRTEGRATFEAAHQWSNVGDGLFEILDRRRRERGTA